jgi:hypothetical protein
VYTIGSSQSIKIIINMDNTTLRSDNIFSFVDPLMPTVLPPVRNVYVYVRLPIFVFYMIISDALYQCTYIYPPVGGVGQLISLGCARYRGRMTDSCLSNDRFSELTNISQTQHATTMFSLSLYLFSRESRERERRILKAHSLITHANRLAK